VAKGQKSGRNRARKSGTFGSVSNVCTIQTQQKVEDDRGVHLSGRKKKRKEKQCCAVHGILGRLGLHAGTRSRA
jgi:hypothetical protein